MSGMQRTDALTLAARVVGRTHVTLRILLRRWYDCFIESQAQKAELSIREHIKFVPDEVLRRAGYRRRRKQASEI